MEHQEKRKRCPCTASQDVDDAKYCCADECYKSQGKTTLSPYPSQQENSIPSRPCGVIEDDTYFGDSGEFDYLKVPKIPRSSSLKFQKTPPGTPTRRKSVRFADALGLDLALVRHILSSDEFPTVPSNATQEPGTGDEVYKKPILVSVYWRLCFPQPDVDVAQRVLEKKVLLESCVVDSSKRKVYGTVRVANVAYEKNIRVRYTTNGWLISEDIAASYVEQSNDLVTDRFSFLLAIPTHLGARNRLEFAIAFCIGCETFWDNNCNRNYALECVETYHNL